MRDPARIDEVLEALRVYWIDRPDLRFCQIVGNFLGEEYAETLEPNDPMWWPVVPVMDSRGYSTEDDVLLAYLRGQNAVAR